MYRLSNWTNSWLIKLLLIFFVAIYLYSMVVYPYYLGGWNNLHSVWFVWQSFNAGMVALLAALIAAGAAISIARRQEQTEFEAAKALLAESLSSLTHFLDGTKVLMVEAYQKLQTEKKSKQCLDSAIPELEKDYRAIFSNCISYGPKEVSSILIKILERLQIHRSRMRAWKDRDFHPDSNMIVFSENIISELFYQCELRALINKLFPYARRQAKQLSEFVDQNELIEALVNSSLEGHLEETVRVYIENKFEKQNQETQTKIE